MASELKLSGTTARVILQGNDTIAADQTFTFPDSGGRILTADGNTNNNGDGGSSGNAQVVGYQKGVWTPTVSRGTVAGWNTAWFRIGDAVTIYAHLKDFTDSTNNNLEITGLPYPVVSVTEGRVVGTALIINGQFSGNIPFDQICHGISGMSSTASLGLFASANNNQINQLKYANISSLATFRMFITASYLTNNTNWAPENSATVS